MLNILVVDDEPDLRSSLGQVLRDEGHVVELAADGEAAIARLASQEFHLVVSDVRLPNLDGMTLLRQVRRDFPATEVVLMTAFGSIGDAVTAMKDCAADYLTKPFDVDKLVNVVGRIDDRRRETGDPTPSLVQAMEEHEKELIQRTIRATGERRQRAAKLLGISRKSLWKKLTKYGLQTRRASVD
jgi:DNA-binding NtrC family response regulator